MKLQIDNISEQELYLTINIEKDDYIAEYKEKISNIKKNLNINGFRKGNIPNNIIYEKYGTEIINQIISEKITSELKKVTNSEKYKDLIIQEPLFIETKYDKNQANDSTELKDFQIKFILGFTKKITFEEIKEKLSETEITSLYCKNIENKELLEIINDFILSYYIGKEKNESNTNDILILKNSKDNSIIALPSTNLKINNEEIDLKNKHTGDILNITIDKNTTLDYDDKIFYLINKNYEQNDNDNFTIIKIYSKANKNINEIINNIYTKICDQKKLTQNTFIAEYLDGEINDSQNDIPENFPDIDYTKLNYIFLLQCNYILQNITLLNIKNAILNTFNIEIPTNYISEKVKKLQSKNEYAEEITKNEIILETIKTSILKELKLTMTQEEMINYLSVLSILENKKMSNLLANYCEKNIQNKFLIDNSNYEKKFIEAKLTHEIKSLVKLKKVEINYNNFIEIISSKSWIRYLKI